ncbi:MAG: hypothetical protein KQH79_06950 [Bacteroidetes bacterium]|nr:hypothetical protein [Bacteroidota bacterium]
MRAISYNSKITSAQQVVESLKENVMEIFWEEDPFEFCSSRSILPLIQEEAEYSIKRLHLKEPDQNRYLQKVEQVLGEYCEV